MAGSLRLDEAGVAGLTHALASHGTSASANATTADRALTAAEASVSSPQLSQAVAGFVAQIVGQASQVGDHVKILGAAVDAAARAVLSADATLAADAPHPEPR